MGSGIYGLVTSIKPTIATPIGWIDLLEIESQFQLPGGYLTWLNSSFLELHPHL
jgi:threonine/homoserine efflux transporter RhtA